MAGGVGSRFWPMSRLRRPKQFLDVLGIGESLIQMTYKRMQKVCPLLEREPMTAVISRPTLSRRS